jgi:hypothetical protein
LISNDVSFEINVSDGGISGIEPRKLRALNPCGEAEMWWTRPGSNR